MKKQLIYPSSPYALLGSDDRLATCGAAGVSRVCMHTEPARMRGRRSERCMGNEPANPTSLRNGGDLCSDSTWNNAHSLERRRQTQYSKRDCLSNYDHCRLSPCHPLKFYSHMSFVTEWAEVGFLRDNIKFIIFFSCEILVENAGG